MRRNKVINLLVSYADRLVGLTTEDDLSHLTASEADEIGPYMRLSARLQADMRPVTPAPEFRSRLKSELMTTAAKELDVAVSTKPMPIWHNRWVLVGAAAGSALSVAGVVAAVLLHQRSAAHSKL